MSLAWLGLVALLPVVVDPDATQLEQIEHGYALDGDTRWEQRAEQLAAHAAPETCARASLWLGARALQSGRLARAEAFFAEARSRATQRTSVALAARGLADVALARHAWRDAIKDIDDARAPRDPILARELEEKRSRAVRGLACYGAEWVAWLLFASCLLRYARALRGARLRLPPETRILAPVYALFVFAAWGRDPHVPYAILFMAVGSLVLVTLAFAPTGRRRRLGVDGAWMMLGNLALLYISLRRAGIVDALWETLKFGTDMG